MTVYPGVRPAARDEPVYGREGPASLVLEAADTVGDPFWSSGGRHQLAGTEMAGHTVTLQMRVGDEWVDTAIELTATSPIVGMWLSAQTQYRVSADSAGPEVWLSRLLREPRR